VLSWFPVQVLTAASANEVQGLADHAGIDFAFDKGTSLNRMKTEASSWRGSP